MISIDIWTQMNFDENFKLFEVAAIREYVGQKNVCEISFKVKISEFVRII